jgi:hypothetical protein
LKDLRKVRLKRIFIQEDRDRAIASGLMKNTKFIPGASRRKGKKAPKPKRKKENHFEFFSLRQVSTKEESKGFPAKTKKNG